MRTVTPTLKNRLLALQQTKANNADPHMEVVLLRQKLPIADKKYWQESIVDEVQCTASSTTVRRMSMYRPPDRAYVAYVYNGTMYVKYADYYAAVEDMTWILTETIENVVDCGLAFSGYFDLRDPITEGKYELLTEELPWWSSSRHHRQMAQSLLLIMTQSALPKIQTMFLICP